MSTPSVFEFLDYRRFIEAWIEWKSTQRPGYGLGIFAMNAGLARATLPNVLGGRRHPNQETREGIARALHLDADEQVFLGLLVDLQRATNLDEQGQILREIFGHPRYAAGQRVETEVIEALTSWCSGTIVELSHQADFQADPEWIAARLRPETGLPEVAQALAALQDAGLVGDHAPHRVHTPSQVEHIAARRAHMAALDASKRALVEVPRPERSFHVVTISVPADVVPSVLAETQAFIARLRDLADGYRDEADTVMQVGLQAWRVVPEEPTPR